MDDTLANLATTLALSKGETTNISMCNQWVLPSLDTSDHEDSNAITIATNDEENWRNTKHGKLTKRTGYYWPIMVKDWQEYAKKCESYQIHAIFIHQPPKPLHPIVASWAFDAWGLDIVELITPRKTTYHTYITNEKQVLSKWDDLYVVKETYTNGAYKLVDKDGLGLVR
ncbi:hypothetical protein Sango_2116200 [Sesamum angolense]|uniref:Uncharacterized protein n=1 Tax=Sesamum angolense TaxID=2727404 RepID=A0AAE2BM92_9LAMI|nr:hypothetical protein Sango_2116200 [Sesamum angolense]